MINIEFGMAEIWVIENG